MYKIQYASRKYTVHSMQMLYKIFFTFAKMFSVQPQHTIVSDVSHIAVCPFISSVINEPEAKLK